MNDVNGARIAAGQAITREWGFGGARARTTRATARRMPQRSGQSAPAAPHPLGGQGGHHHAQHPWRFPQPRGHHRATRERGFNRSRQMRKLGDRQRHAATRARNRGQRRTVGLGARVLETPAIDRELARGLFLGAARSRSAAPRRGSARAAARPTSPRTCRRSRGWNSSVREAPPSRVASPSRCAPATARNAESCSVANSRTVSPADASQRSGRTRSGSPCTGSASQRTSMRHSRRPRSPARSSVGESDQRHTPVPLTSSACPRPTWRAIISGGPPPRLAISTRSPGPASIGIRSESGAAARHASRPRTGSSSQRGQLRGLLGPARAWPRAASPIDVMRSARSRGRARRARRRIRPEPGPPSTSSPPPPRTKLASARSNSGLTSAGLDARRAPPPRTSADRRRGLAARAADRPPPVRVARQPTALARPGRDGQARVAGERAAQEREIPVESGAHDQHAEPAGRHLERRGARVVRHRRLVRQRIHARGPDREAALERHRASVRTAPRRPGRARARSRARSRAFPTSRCTRRCGVPRRLVRREVHAHRRRRARRAIREGTSTAVTARSAPAKVADADRVHRQAERLRRGDRIVARR